MLFSVSVVNENQLTIIIISYLAGTYLYIVFMLHINYKFIFQFFVVLV